MIKEPITTPDKSAEQIMKELANLRRMAKDSYLDDEDIEQACESIAIATSELLTYCGFLLQRLTTSECQRFGLKND